MNDISITIQSVTKTESIKISRNEKQETILAVTNTKEGNKNTTIENLGTTTKTELRSKITTDGNTCHITHGNTTSEKYSYNQMHLMINTFMSLKQQ